MSTPVRTLMRSVDQAKNTLELISFFNYPYYDNMFANIGFNLNLIESEHIYSKWDEELLDKASGIKLVGTDLPIYLDADLILCHNKFAQYDVSQMFAQFWHLPIVLIHQLLPRDLKFRNEWNIFKNRVGDVNIFLSREIQQAWETPGHIIPPGIELVDTTKTSNKIGHLFCAEQKVRSSIQNILGPTKFVQKNDFSEVEIFVNTTTDFYPIHVLHAMAAGCLVITQQLPELDGVIKHEVNGLIFKNIYELKQLLDLYKNKPSKCREMAALGRTTIQNLFPMKNFQNIMKIVLKEASTVVYTRKN